MNIRHIERARYWAKEQQDKIWAERLKLHPKIVKEHLTATRDFRDSLSLAIKAMQADKFAPEAIRFLLRWHKQVMDLLKEFERMSI